MKISKIYSTVYSGPKELRKFLNLENDEEEVEVKGLKLIKALKLLGLDELDGIKIKQLDRGKVYTIRMPSAVTGVRG